MQQILFSKLGKAHMLTLQYLVKIRGLDFTISDVARNTEMTRATLYKVWKDLVKLGVIIKTRQIGVAKLYKLNEDNKITKAVVSLYKALLIKMVEGIEEKMKINTKNKELILEN